MSGENCGSVGCKSCFAGTRFSHQQTCANTKHEGLHSPEHAMTSDLYMSGDSPTSMHHNLMSITCRSNLVYNQSSPITVVDSRFETMWRRSV